MDALLNRLSLPISTYVLQYSMTLDQVTLELPDGCKEFVVVKKLYHNNQYLKRQLIVHDKLVNLKLMNINVYNAGPYITCALERGSYDMIKYILETCIKYSSRHIPRHRCCDDYCGTIIGNIFARPDADVMKIVKLITDHFKVRNVHNYRIDRLLQSAIHHRPSVFEAILDLFGSIYVGDTVELIRNALASRVGVCAQVISKKLLTDIQEVQWMSNVCEGRGILRSNEGSDRQVVSYLEMHLKYLQSQNRGTESQQIVGRANR